MEDAVLDDTYVAALQHDLVDTGDALLLGVVRRPTPWLHGAVDDNEPAVAPPEALLDEFQRRKEELVEEGVDDAEAHRQVWSEMSFEDRYLDHLVESEEATPAVERVVEQLESGRSVYLVCYENTEEKPCHRTALREFVSERRG